METKFIYAAIYDKDGIVESVMGIPEGEVAGYGTGTDQFFFEILDEYEQVPLSQMQAGKIIRRVGVKQYELQDAP
jgi:hypothetical protein